MSAAVYDLRSEKNRRKIAEATQLITEILSYRRLYIPSSIRLMSKLTRSSNSDSIQPVSQFIFHFSNAFFHLHKSKTKTIESSQEKRHKKPDGIDVVALMS